MSGLGIYPKTRLRRLRQHSLVRELVRETQLSIKDLVFPLFIKQNLTVKHPIASMPGQFQLGLTHLQEELASLVSLGINNILLFGIPAQKDHQGEEAYAENGIIQTALIAIKKHYPQLLIMTDVCLCDYTLHGHCGIVTKTKGQAEIDNDQTLTLLVKQAVSHAKAGADIIAPSGMIDGMVYAIRTGLDQAGFTHIPILSYAVKYASSLYAPFRDAAESTPTFGDRHTHQMDLANSHEAIRECALDIAEGADMLMVKPAHTYLDIIAKVKQAYPALPLAAYHTSGEYAMIKAAAAAGWLDEKTSALEVLTSIRRAGADFIFTYFAKDVALWLA